MTRKHRQRRATQHQVSQTDGRTEAAIFKTTYDLKKCCSNATRRASVFLHLSVLHEMRREIRVLRDVTLAPVPRERFVTANPDRTTRSRFGAREIRVFLLRISRSRCSDSSDSPDDNDRIPELGECERERLR